MTYDRAVRGIVGGALAALLAACVHAQAAPNGSSAMASVEHRYRELPARLCLDADPAVWDALAAGSTRLALHIRNHTPSKRYSPTFTVRLAGAGEKTQRDVDTLTMTVDRVAESGEQPEPQHFLIDLSHALTGQARTPQVCVEIDFDRNDTQAKALMDARVTLSADWQSIKR